MFEKVKAFVVSLIGKVVLISLVAISVFAGGYLVRGKSIENRVLGQLQNYNTNLIVVSDHLSRLEAEMTQLLKKK